MAGGSSTSWTGAFIKPDPMDPNDRVRQKTQSRSGEYPYDRPVSYGRPVGTDSGGGAYHREPDGHPPVPRNRKAADRRPIGPWNQLEALTDPYEPGPRADNANAFGYGARGRMGDGLDPEELDMDMLRRDFRDTFIGTLPRAREMDARSLFALLTAVDPDCAAELFAPDDDDEMFDTYLDWGAHVYAPGAEEDQE